MRKEINAKIKVLEILEENGITTEEDLTKLDTRRMLKMNGISIPTMRAIVDLQEAVRNNKLFSYLLDQSNSTEARESSI